MWIEGLPSWQTYPSQSAGTVTSIRVRDIQVQELLIFTPVPLSNPRPGLGLFFLDRRSAVNAGKGGRWGQHGMLGVVESRAFLTWQQAARFPGKLWG